MSRVLSNRDRLDALVGIGTQMITCARGMAVVAFAPSGAPRLRVSSGETVDDLFRSWPSWSNEPAWGRTRRTGEREVVHLADVGDLHERPEPGQLLLDRLQDAAGTWGALVVLADRRPEPDEATIGTFRRHAATLRLDEASDTSGPFPRSDHWTSESSAGAAGRIIVRRARGLGMSIVELYIAYLAVGGSASRYEIEALLSSPFGIERSDYDLLALAINEQCLELGVVADCPYSDQIEP